MKVAENIREFHFMKFLSFCMSLRESCSPTWKYFIFREVL